MEIIFYVSMHSHIPEMRDKMNESKPRDCAANCGVILSQFMYTCTTQVSCITLSVREEISFIGPGKIIIHYVYCCFKRLLTGCSIAAIRIKATACSLYRVDMF